MCGLGQRQTQVEKLSYDIDVRVMWQKKGWLDRASARDWADNVWKPFVRESFKNKEPVLLVCDSVDAQRCRSFARDLAMTQTKHHLGEPGYTHVWQTVDRHVGKTLRDLFSDVQLEHLIVDENWEKFVKLKAWERRVLITQWAGEAWRGHSVESGKACSRRSGGSTFSHVTEGLP